MPPRSKGDFPQSVKENCSLVVTGLNTGSIHAQMQIGDTQEGLFEAQTFGERAIDIANNLLNLLSNDDMIETDTLNPKIYDIINNPHRLNRVLRDYEAIHLNPSRKDLIRSIIQKPPKEYENGLLVVEQNMELAFKEAQEELAVLVAEYVDAPEDDLTEGAKKFRNKLINLLE